MWVFLVSWFVILKLAFTGGSCVWYGICSQSTLSTYYCAYNGSALPLNKTMYHTLARLCPDLATGEGSTVCCNDEMLTYFANNMKAANSMLRRCPACFANFRMLFCSMTCGPNQAEYMVPTVTNNYVTSVDYLITDYVADSLFSSCKDVSLNTGRAIDAFCDSSECTRDLLFKNLGKSMMNGGHSPFTINFLIGSKSSSSSPINKPMNKTFFRCNQSVPKRANDPGGDACACGDCPSACSDQPISPPTPNEPYRILGLDVWMFGAVIVFCALTLIFSTIRITKMINGLSRYKCDKCTDHVDYHQMNEKQYRLDQNLTAFTRISATVNEVLVKLFTKLGYLIAHRPIICLSASALVVAILSCGLFLMQVTTNPIDLWSGRYSRSRLEKDYFDSQFVPFYRTEQIIIRPVNQSNFTRPQANEAVLGAAFDKQFLLKVYELHQAIMSITVDVDANDKSNNVTEKITIKDICFQPLSPDNQNCAVLSPLEYFQNNLTFFNYVASDDWGYFVADYVDHLLYCAQSPLSVSGSPLLPQAGCLSSSGIPIEPGLAFGAFNGNYYNGSGAVVLTYLVNNDPNLKSDQIRKAERWESAYIDLVKQWQAHETNLSIRFQAERSVQDEIERQSQSDISTVAISYIVMFVYVSIFLGSYQSFRTMLIDVRITLGFGGVLIVLASVLASVGFWSFLQVPITLIIIEVIPFLVLAVGVDNIFILVHEFEQVKLMFAKRKWKTQNGTVEQLSTTAVQSSTNTSTACLVSDSGPHRLKGSATSVEMKTQLNYLVERQIATCLGRVGPSILLTALAESVAFFCGALTSMPAVRVFALYAAMAIVFNFLLQLFAFVALLTLDARRCASRRFDICCCFGVSDSEQYETVAGGRLQARVNGNHHSTNQEQQQQQQQPEEHISREQVSPVEENSGDEIFEVDLTNAQTTTSTTQVSNVNTESQEPQSANLLHHVMADYFTPLVMNCWLRPCLLIISLAWICYAAAILPNGIHIGMDQRLAMPEDSYMLDYFNAIAEDLRIGPPVYFVVTQGHDYSTEQGQNQICGGVGCSEQSLVGQINKAFTISSYSWIANRASSWLDDYFDWIDPEGAPNCCRIHQNSKTGQFCYPTDKDQSDCITCPVSLNASRPISADFNKYIPYFLAENPSPSCPKAGKAAYNHAVKLDPNSTRIGATYFMTYHNVLKHPDDFLKALIAARTLADNITQSWKTINNSLPITKTEHDPLAIDNNIVYPYSVFYVFYEQYLSLVNEAIFQFTICILAIAIVTYILLGLNLLATVAVILGLLYIVVSVSAIMVLWSISFNALSLVNLVVALGISVEFCAHIVQAFILSPKFTRLERSVDALTNMGSSLLRGITLTKLGGIVVLATSKSRLFQIFYFRMYLTIIIFGALTGLIVLPVFLSYFGPPLNLAIAKRYYSAKPRRID